MQYAEDLVLFRFPKYLLNNRLLVRKLLGRSLKIGRERTALEPCHEKLVVIAGALGLERLEEALKDGKTRGFVAEGVVHLEELLDRPEILGFRTRTGNLDDPPDPCRCVIHQIFVAKHTFLEPFTDEGARAMRIGAMAKIIAIIEHVKLRNNVAIALKVRVDRGKMGNHRSGSVLRKLNSPLLETGKEDVV
jgi:hypothetical protein